MSARVRYRCARCDADIILEAVDEIVVVRPGVVGITYDCECSITPAIVAHFQYSPPALHDLFGADFPQLPWYNPLRPDLSPDEIEQEVQSWAWEIDECVDADEFIGWLDRYSSTD